jgi:WD40 repeat protein
VSIYDIVTNRGAAEEDAAASKRRRRDASPSTRNKEGTKTKRKGGNDDDEAIPGTELYRAYACPSAHVTYGPGGQARVQRVVSMKGHVLGDVPAGVVSVPATLMEPCESKLTAADHLQSLSNGELVALAAETGTVDMHLLHPSDIALAPVQSFHVHSQWVSRLQAAPGLDGFYSASTDGSMLLTHAEKGEVLQSLSPQMVGGLRKPIFTFDADDLHCMVAYPMGRKVHVWSSITGVCHATLTEHEATVTQVALNPLQHEVVTLQADKTIKVWDTRMWKVCDTIVDKRTRHPENVLSTIGCIPQRGLLLSASASLIGWRSRVAQEYVDAGIQGPIRANAAKPRLDGSAGPDSGDMPVAAEDPAGAAVCHINPIVAAIVAPVSGHIVVLDRKKAIVWSLTDHKPLAQWHWPLDSTPLAALLDPAELRLLVGSDEGGVRWLNYCCGHVTRELKHTFPAVGVGAVAHLHQAAPPLTAAAVGRHVGLWLDGLTHARPEAPQLSAQVPVECGSVVGITWPTGSMPSMGSSLIVATASGTTLVYTMSNMAVAFRVPPPEVMGNGEGTFDLVPGLMASAHHNGAIRLLAFERDSLCVSVGYFGAAHTKAETIASSVYLSKRAGWAMGDTCGRISVFRIGDLNAGFRNDKLFSLRRSGQLSEADVVDRHVDLSACWTAHPGQTVASLAYVEARKELISAGADCAVRVWNIAAMRLVAELGGRQDGIPRSFEAGPGSKDFDTHAFTQANGPSAPAGGAKLAVDYSVGVPKPGTASHALLTSALDQSPPTSTVGHFLLGRRSEFSPGQLPRHAATPHPNQARVPRPQPTPGVTPPEASPIATRQASPELAHTTDPQSKQRARRGFHLPALGGPARRLFSRARTSGGMGSGGIAMEPPAVADDATASAQGSVGRRRFNRSDLDALENQDPPPALSGAVLAEATSSPPLPPPGRFSPLGRQSPASPRGVGSPKSTSLGSPAMSPRGRREVDDSPRVTSVRERPSAVGMSDLDAQVWQAHDMLCRVSRRTQRLRCDLPSVEAPLVSGTVQAHLGEVARVREGKLHDDTSSLKASHGGGFRGLALPNFTIPKAGTHTKSRDRNGLQ